MESEANMASSIEEQIPKTKKKVEKPADSDPRIQEFFATLEQAVSPEAKLHVALAFMKTSIAGEAGAFFSGFWEGRRRALALFREEIPQGIRTELWAEFSQMSEEAKQLKNLLDAESSFAVEQIELAIQAVEEGIAQLETQVAGAPKVQPSEVCEKVLQENVPQYDAAQRELNLLNIYAARVNALRQELLKLEMRVRHKHQIFKRLSSLGDAIFPKRKALMKTISELFSKDIESFVGRHFIDQRVVGPIFELRETIKALQSFAKELTLNPSTFANTRQKLSQCWDQIKVLDKERKKAKTEHKEKSRQGMEAATALLTPVLEAFQKQELSAADADKKLDELTRNLLRSETDKDAKKNLREHFDSLRQPVRDELSRQEELYRERLAQQEQKKREQLETFHGKLKALEEQASVLSIEDLTAQREALLVELAALPASKSEKMLCEGKLKQLRDMVASKKEEALLQHAGGDDALARLKVCLQERVQQRSEIKKQLEEYRKNSSESGWDFAKAILQQQLIAQEKQALENIERSIEEIEIKIAELEG